MNTEEVRIYLETLKNDEIIPDGTKTEPEMTESDLKKIAGFYKNGIKDASWLQIQIKGAGDLPYTRSQINTVLQLCDWETKRRENP